MRDTEKSTVKLFINENEYIGTLTLDRHFDLVHFLITLEFIFGVSELTEAGSGFYRWDQGTGGHHPFKNYLLNYKIELDNLHDAVGKHRRNTK